MSWVPPDRPPGDTPAAPRAGRAWPPPEGQPRPAAPPTGQHHGPPRPDAEAPRGLGGAGPLGPPPRDRKRLVVAVAVALVVIFAVAAAIGLLAEGDERGEDAGVAPTVPAPAPRADSDDTSTTAPEQDPGSAPGNDAALTELEANVAELSAYVSEVRGRPFLVPVKVELAEGQAFDDRLLADFEEEREDIDLVGRLLVALGLLEDGTDLYETYRELLGAGVLGFYDPETGELVVRGAAVTPYTRSTIVHELVHAYDDQHFELHRPALDDASDETGLAFTALLEGNAVRVQQRWEADLSPEERAELQREQLAAVAGADFGDVPDVLLAQLQLPYTAGPVLVDALLDAGGEGRVDEAFASPPTTSEQVLEPEAYLGGEAPLPVPVPPADGDVVDQGTYGQLMVLLTLRELLDDETARTAADGWGGDAYVAWTEGDATCVRVSFRMDSPADLRELRAAWSRWATERDASVDGEPDDAVTITACG